MTKTFTYTTPSYHYHQLKPTGDATQVVQHVTERAAGVAEGVQERQAAKIERLERVIGSLIDVLSKLRGVGMTAEALEEIFGYDVDVLEDES